MCNRTENSFVRKGKGSLTSRIHIEPFKYNQVCTTNTAYSRRLSHNTTNHTTCTKNLFFFFKASPVSKPRNEQKRMRETVPVDEKTTRIQT
jgi:hypothetical protein